MVHYGKPLVIDKVRLSLRVYNLYVNCDVMVHYGKPLGTGVVQTSSYREKGGRKERLKGETERLSDGL